jgi:hypothetical protein
MLPGRGDSLRVAREGGKRMASRRMALAVALAVFVAGLVSNGCGGGGTGGREITIDTPVTIKRAFQEGEQIKYKFAMENQSGVKLTSYEQSISSLAEFKTTNTITKVGPEEIEMVMRFDYAVGGMTYGDAMMADESISALRGKELSFVLDRDGQVVSWSGLSGEDAAESGAGQLALLLYDVFPPLPDGPITIGTSWTEPLDIPQITSAAEQDIIGETTYTVTGFKAKYEINCAEIQSVTSFEFEGRAEQGGDVWLMSGAGTSTGTMLVSIEDGTIVVSKSQMELELTGEGSAVAGAAGSETVNMGVKSTLEIELL